MASVPPWGAVCPPLRAVGDGAPALRTRLVLDRRGTARDLRGALDLAARLAAPAAVLDRLPVSVAGAPPHHPRRPTIWIAAAAPSRPPADPDDGTAWPSGTRAWAVGTAADAPLWQVGGAAPAVTRLLRALAGDRSGRFDQATAVAWSSGRAVAWVPGSGGGRWRAFGTSRAGAGRDQPGPFRLESLLPGGAEPPPRLILPDAVPAAVVCAAANLVARLQLGADRLRDGPLGLRPGEPGAATADLLLPARGGGPTRIRRGAAGAARLEGGAAAALLERLALADPLAVEDPLEQLADRVRWPEPVGGAGGGIAPTRVRAVAPWEGERLVAAAGRCRRGGGDPYTRVECFASEPGREQARLAAAIARELGIPPRLVLAAPAYHQAAGWLRDTAADALTGSGATALRLEVPRGPRARPASWAITALGGLERLAARLRIAPDRVTVTVARSGTSGGALAPFRLTAVTPRGERTLTFRPLTVAGGAYPGDRSETSGLRLHRPGAAAREIAVASDHVAAVELFEAEVLPRALALAHRRRAVRIELRVTVSEPDAEDGTGAFSPLEELHEELYFRTHGAARAGGGRLVLVPDVRARPGRPTQLEARIVDGGTAGLTVAEPQPVLTEVALPRGAREGLTLTVDWNGGEPPPGSRSGPAPLDRLRSLDRRGRRWLWTPSRAGSGVAPRGVRPDPERLPDPGRIAANLARVREGPAVAAWIAGRSTLGRPIAAMAALPWPLPIGSLAKAALLRPTVLLVGGHHANEVSSTGAHLALAHELARGWRPGAVLVCLPLENPDGALVHRRLARRHPTWKLHAARFNGVGEEFGGSPRPLQSPFGEARPRARLLGRLGADCLVDDHGVPDHVWAQPLAGRSSPPYFPIAYTLPPGLLYVIGETDPAGDRATGWTAAVHSAVAREFRADPGLLRRHRALWQGYVRYGAGLDPTAFPSRPVEGLPLQARRTATRGARAGGDRGRGTRYPLALDLVTEVADETSRGADLGRAVRAHLVADRAILDTAAAAVVPARWVRVPGGWRLRRTGPCPAPGPPPPRS